MLSGLTDLSFPDASTLTEKAKQAGPAAGLLGVGAGVAAAGITVSPAAPLASVVLPAIASTCIEGGTIRAADEIEGNLRNLAENHDEDDHSRRRAALTKCSQGCLKLLDPLVSDKTDAESATALAQTDPEAFTTLIEQVFQSDSEELQRIETELQRLFAADPDADDTDPQEILHRIQDTFEVDSTQEAVQLLHMYKTFMSDVKTTAADQTDDPDVLDTLDQLDDCLNAMEKATTDIFEDLLQIELGNQGFEWWKITSLHNKDPFKTGDPRNKWGFGQLDLPALVADGDPDSEFEIGGIKTGEKQRPFRQAVTEQLGSNTPVVITAGPECGKSTVCKRVAYEWVNHDKGTVFYRSSDATQPFTKQALRTAIKNAQDFGDEMPLVVVEDVTREAINNPDIFEIIHWGLNDASDVAFLLDSRTSEWTEFEETTTDRVVDPEFGESPLVELPLPELSVATCREAKEAFNQLTGAYYSSDAETLYEKVTEQTPSNRRAYELSTLATILRREGLDSDRTPLGQSGKNAYEQILEPIDDSHTRITVADVTDPTDPDAMRRALVATAINLLNTAEYPVEPELLFGLAFVDPAVKSADADKSAVLESVQAISNLLTDAPDEGGFNRQIVRTDPDSVTVAPLETRPPSWSKTFLEQGLKQSDTDLMQSLVTVAVVAMTSLADDPREDVPGLAGVSGDQRRAILYDILKYCISDGRLKLPEADRDLYLETFDEEPADTVSNLLTEIYEWAQRGLSSLDQNPETWRRELLQPDLDEGSEVSETAPDDEGFSSIGGDSGIGANVGSDIDENTLCVHRTIPSCCPATFEYGLRSKLISGENSEAKMTQLNALESERESADGVSASRGIAQAYLWISRSSSERETKEEALKKARDVFDKANADEKVASIYCEMGSMYEYIDRTAAKEYYKTAIERYDHIDDDSQVAETYRSIATMYEDTDKATAKEYYKTAIERYDKIDDDSEVAQTYRSIAGMYTDTDKTTAKEYYKTAIERYDKIDDDSEVAQTYRWMAEMYEETDKATAEEYYKTAIERYDKIGDDNEVAWTYRWMVWMYEETDKATAEGYCQDEINRYDKIGDDSQVALACKWTAEMYEETDKATAEGYCQDAIERYDKMGDDNQVAQMYRWMAEMYEETDKETAEGYYKTAIERYDKIGHDSQVALTYREMAGIYTDTDKATAEEYYKTAIEQHDGIDDDSGVAEVYRMMAKMYKKTDKAAAIEFYRKGVERAPDITNVIEMRLSVAQLEIEVDNQQAAVDLAQTSVENCLTAIQNDEMTYRKYDHAVYNLATLLETIVTATQQEASVPSAIVEQASDLLDTAADEIDEETYGAFQTVLTKLRS